jgi:glycine/D-amino acid oxidase-like deaminating enzyme
MTGRRCRGGVSQPAAACRAPVPVRRAIVIGAGVAGSSAAHRLCARGWQVTLIERHAQPAQEASGNLAGIFMPLLSKDDNIPTRLSRAAYLFALREWRAWAAPAACLKAPTAACCNWRAMRPRAGAAGSAGAVELPAGIRAGPTRRRPAP